MKREIRSMEVGINTANFDIIFEKYSCPAGESGHCNHGWLKGGLYYQQIHLQNNQSWTQL